MGRISIVGTDGHTCVAWPETGTLRTRIKIKRRDAPALDPPEILFEGGEGEKLYDVVVEK